MLGNKKAKFFILSLPVLAFIALAVWYLHGTNIPVLEPAGQIGDKQRQLIIIGLLLSVIVVVPVYVMTIVIALRYSETNHKKHKVKYSPDWDHSRLYESLWWGIPIVIIAILSVVTWRSSHALDPYRPLVSNVKPITVQVVALDWKWLFIYPQQHIASVNLVEMPVNTPVDFEITSDAVMNSFWIPQLGGQIYAMPGMSTELHLIANRDGSFYGSPANIAGNGFADMTFKAKSVSGADFNKWTQTAATDRRQLDMTTYEQLTKPSQSLPISYYSNPANGLYDAIIIKYMTPSNSQNVNVPGNPPKQTGYAQ